MTDPYASQVPPNPSETGAASLPTSGGSGSSTRRKAPWIVGAAAVALLAGGAFAVTRSLGGSGSQPEEVLPGEALMYLRVDMDPSVGQKVAAFRFFDKFPEAKQALTDQNPKRALFDLIKKNNSDLKDIDYTNDIEPWLGDRAGLALLAPTTAGGQPIPVLAVQVKDEAKASAGMQKLQTATQRTMSKLPTSGSTSAFGAALNAGAPVTAPSSVTFTPEPTSSESSTQTSHFFRDGYMLVASQPDEQNVRAAVDRGTLAAKSEFTDDMKAVGEPGVISAWIDQPKLVDAAAKASPNNSDNTAAAQELGRLMGRQAMAVRFQADYIEADSFSRGNPLELPQNTARDIGTLPANTAALISFTDGDVAVPKMWNAFINLAKQSSPNVDQQISQLEQQAGLKLPDDLATLFGKQFDVVMAEPPAGEANQMPKIGVRMTTDTSRAESIISTLKGLLNRSGQSAPNLPQSTKDGRVLLATDQGYLDELSNGTPGFSGQPGLAAAVPDLDKATSVIYLDLNKLEPLYIDNVDAQQREYIRALKAVGVRSTKADDGSRSLIRILAD